jgi:hypothetical protein
VTVVIDEEQLLLDADRRHVVGMRLERETRVHERERGDGTAAHRSVVSVVVTEILPVARVEKSRHPRWSP